MKNPTHFITVNNKKHPYILKNSGKKWTRVVCNAASIDQRFLTEDIPALLIDLPNLIVAEQEYQKKQNEMIRFRVSSEDKKKIQEKAARKGYPNISGFLRDLALRS